MFRPFMKVPTSILVVDTTQPEENQQAQILRLPKYVLDLIFDELDILERCTVALTCRKLLTFALHNEHLDYLISLPPTVFRLEQFFQRLSRGWIPIDSLRYCSDCGKFMSTDPYHWRHISEKYTRESVGRIPEIWRQRREDGWLRYWIERWCSTEDDRTSTAAALKHADSTELLCPRCAMLNPATNDWRLGRIAARNERHATTRAQRIMSPGMNSPYLAGSGGTAAAAIMSSPDFRNRSPLSEARWQVPGRGTAVAKKGVGAGLGIQPSWI